MPFWVYEWIKNIKILTFCIFPSTVSMMWFSLAFKAEIRASMSARVLAFAASLSLMAALISTPNCSMVNSTVSITFKGDNLKKKQNSHLNTYVSEG